MTLADWRDIALIILVLFFTIQTLVVIVLVSVLIKVAMEVRDKADAILASTQRTMQNINGTATFVGNTVARPIIKSVSFAYGLRRTVGALARIARRKNGR